ncbi:FCD domain-containing protein [Azospirillum sp.]|uniref:FCD domain-containing protein n=1 Tax=Azospirillum sp. TaxID=34012 RepID=UPI002D533B02|nr:FCD domain-containing protein [Azospirillum sp.]HYD65271.1 FCD domain-containing protein [Azospirillum sp.]
MKADSIKPAKLADTVAQHLERLILEGALRPGERLLAERELAAKLDISRPSLRDALAKLAERGLLVADPHGATYVAESLGATFRDPLVQLLRENPEATFDYLEFRSTVEGSAAYYAASRATQVDRDAIREAYERMEASHGKDDSSEEADADADFHLAIYEATHNVVLLHIMRSLSDLLRNDIFYNRAKLYERKGVRDLLIDQHKAVYEAVMDGDPERARDAASHHITYINSALQEIRNAEARLEVSLRRMGRADLVDLGGRKRKNAG